MKCGPPSLCAKPFDRARAAWRREGTSYDKQRSCPWTQVCPSDSPRKDKRSRMEGKPPMLSSGLGQGKTKQTKQMP